MIRKAVLSDLDALVEIENTAFAGNRLSRRSLRSMITNPKALMLVSDEGGQVAAYGLLLYRKGVRFARLYSFAVREDFRGQGVSSRLLTTLETLCEKSNIRLEVRSDNTAAISFYRRHEFSEIARRDNYYDDGHTAIIMEKNILK